MSEHVDPFERMLYKAERERDDARRQMQSLTEDYVAMEARAIAAERERDELRRELDARTDPDLAARLRGIAEVYFEFHEEDGDDVERAARLLGGGE